MYSNGNPMGWDGMGWDRHKLLWDGMGWDRKICPMGKPEYITNGLRDSFQKTAIVLSKYK